MTEEYKAKLLRSANEGEPILAHLGITFTDLSDGWAVAKLKQQSVVMNTWGLPHGGALFTMADVAAGVAALTLRPETLVTLNASIDYMDGAAPEGDITAVAKVERMGGKTCFCSVEMYDCNEKRIAALHTVMYFTGGELKL
ncbi:MAG: PaaI family thioesterase [Oscillospiraceae bacterium]|nr:PaaI family thioesterase [Oscillospiraceae bacterium]